MTIPSNGLFARATSSWGRRRNGTPFTMPPNAGSWRDVGGIFLWFPVEHRLWKPDFHSPTLQPNRLGMEVWSNLTWHERVFQGYGP